MMSCTSCVGELAEKGGCPAAHSYRMQPSAHKSLAVLCGPLWNSSGAMYAGDALFACMCADAAAISPESHTFFIEPVLHG